MSAPSRLSPWYLALVVATAVAVVVAAATLAPRSDQRRTDDEAQAPAAAGHIGSEVVRSDGASLSQAMIFLCAEGRSDSLVKVPVVDGRIEHDQLYGARRTQTWVVGVEWRGMMISAWSDPFRIEGSLRGGISHPITLVPREGTIADALTPLSLNCRDGFPA